MAGLLGLFDWAFGGGSSAGASTGAPSLWSIAGGAVDAMATLYRTQELAQRQEQSRDELLLRARIEGVNADRAALDRQRAINRMMAANLARAGALGQVQAPSLTAIAGEALRLAGEEDEVDRISADVTAAIARSRAALVDTDETIGAGVLGAAAQFFRPFVAR